MSERDGPESEEGRRPEDGLRCDFCGRETATVRRIALDRGYDRLRPPHIARYACPACSVKKERERTGLAPV
jgi:hypothetical protein